MEGKESSVLLIMTSFFGTISVAKKPQRNPKQRSSKNADLETFKHRVKKQKTDIMFTTAIFYIQFVVLLWFYDLSTRNLCFSVVCAIDI